MTDIHFLTKLIADVGLDLKGLKIYTEAASGHYMTAPILATLAGASHVTAQVKDSKFGSVREIVAKTYEHADAYAVVDKIECVTERSYKRLQEADIVTNSGHVRPIDRDLISALKPTAVIPLMWETWEFRSEDFDLECCKKKGILVLGTKEQEPPCDMRRYVGLTGIKQLLDLGYDGGKVMLLGNAPLPGLILFDYFKRLDIEVTWISDDPRAFLSYDELNDHFLECGHSYSHIIVAEHKNPRLLIGNQGILCGKLIHAINPNIRIGMMCGNVEQIDLQRFKLTVSPSAIAPFGFMSYLPYELGPRPVLNLFAAGLKIGEQMAKARLSGQTPELAAQTVIAQGLAMDFIGDMAWMKI
jgi:hypothetical protein